MKFYGIYSAGGFACEVKPIVQERISELNDASRVVYVDDDPAKIGSFINDTKVISYSDFKLLEKNLYPWPSQTQVSENIKQKK